MALARLAAKDSAVSSFHLRALLESKAELLSVTALIYGGQGEKVVQGGQVRFWEVQQRSKVATRFSRIPELPDSEALIDISAAAGQCRKGNKQ